MADDGQEEAVRRYRSRGGMSRVLACWAQSLLAATLWLFATAAVAQDVQVILAPDREATVPDRRLLLSIYIGRVTLWPDGRPVRVFTLADDQSLHERFCRQMLGTYPYVLRNAWDKLVYTGTGFAPTVVANENEMRRRVQSTPGAIGYVAANGEGALSDYHPYRFEPRIAVLGFTP
jgi:ABC-type phosphate transport system substrate-binding protein